MPARLRRFVALCRKETWQILRDPSTLLMAFVFPLILLLVFGAGINLDSAAVRLGLVVQDPSPAAARFAAALAASPTFRVVRGRSVDAMGDALRAGEVHGFVLVRDDFARRVVAPAAGRSPVLVVTDGAEPNTAAFVAADVSGAYGVWRREEARRSGVDPARGGLTLETRSWFNPSTKSRNFLLPGSITIIMTVVGALLTALVVAREWERGTMESLLAANVSRVELVSFKLVPYFGLGIIAYALCVTVAHFGFGVPLRGSVAALALVGATFLGSALGLGLLLSTVLRNQYNAAQAALNAAFLPATMLSGFVFEIASMPAPIRAVTWIVPARYFATAMQTLFQAGNVWSVLGRSLLGLGLAAVGFIGLTLLNTRRRIE